MKIAESITVGGTTLHGIFVTGDLSPKDACAIARKYQPSDLTLGIVDHQGGLVVYSERAMLPWSPSRTATGIYFRTPRCGGTGEEVRATAKIMSILGFGQEDQIFDSISRVEHFTFHLP